MNHNITLSVPAKDGSDALSSRRRRRRRPATSTGALAPFRSQRRVISYGSRGPLRPSTSTGPVRRRRKKKRNLKLRKKREKEFFMTHDELATTASGVVDLVAMPVYDHTGQAVEGHSKRICCVPVGEGMDIDVDDDDDEGKRKNKNVQAELLRSLSQSCFSLDTKPRPRYKHRLSLPVCYSQLFHEKTQDDASTKSRRRTSTSKNKLRVSRAGDLRDVMRSPESKQREDEATSTIPTRKKKKRQLRLWIGENKTTTTTTTVTKEVTKKKKQQKQKPFNKNFRSFFGSNPRVSFRVFPAPEDLLTTTISPSQSRSMSISERLMAVGEGEGTDKRFVVLSPARARLRRERIRLRGKRKRRMFLKKKKKIGCDVGRSRPAWRRNGSTIKTNTSGVRFGKLPLRVHGSSIRSQRQRPQTSLGVGNRRRRRRSGRIVKKSNRIRQRPQSSIPSRFRKSGRRASSSSSDEQHHVASSGLVCTRLRRHVRTPASARRHSQCTRKRDHERPVSAIVSMSTTTPPFVLTAALPTRRHLRAGHATGCCGFNYENRRRYGRPGPVVTPTVGNYRRTAAAGVIHVEQGSVPLGETLLLDSGTAKREEEEREEEEESVRQAGVSVRLLSCRYRGYDTVMKLPAPRVEQPDEDEDDE